MPEKIILDCDPGIDDALALMLALASPEVDLLGVTTVVGNHSLDAVTENALKLLELTGRTDVPVVAGCRQPILGPFSRGWASAHGHDGLGNVGLPTPKLAARSGHAVDFMIDAVMSSPGEVTLCPIGPMTNVALAITKEPRVARAVKRIVFMGGAAFVPGNATPLAEFNIYVDPEAASAVTRSGAPLVMLGLDVTTQAKFDLSWVDRIAEGDAAEAKMAAMLRAYGGADLCLHDPCAVAYLIEPGLFSTEQGLLSVIVDGAARGKTVVATVPRHMGDQLPNATVVVGCNVARLLDLFATSLRKARLGAMAAA